jgi:hypothetical protein
MEVKYFYSFKARQIDNDTTIDRENFMRGTSVTL